MKRIFILSLMVFLTLILYQSNTYSQSDEIDCTGYIETFSDRMTGKTSLHSIEYVNVPETSGESGISMSLYQRSGADLIINFKVYGAGNCIGEDNSIIILLEDDNRIFETNKSDFNCENNAQVFFFKGLNKDKLNLLKTKKVIAIRVYTQNGYVEKDFSEKNQNDFINIVNCILK